MTIALGENGTLISYERVLEQYRSNGSAPIDPSGLVAAATIELCSYDSLLSNQQEVAKAWNL
jgi:hypothetical protein